MKIKRLIPKICLIFIYTIVSILIIGELLVRKLKPQLTFSQVYLLSDKCYRKSDVTPFTLLKNVSCKMKEENGDFETEAHTNSLGFRGSEFPESKPISEKRILLLGDSFAFGYGLPDDQTIAVKLEKKLNKKEIPVRVINAGFTDGFSPDAYYAFLKAYGVKLSPDILAVLFFPYNDLNDLTETVWYNVDEYGLPSIVESSIRVVDQGVFRYINTDIEYRYPIIRESHLFNLIIKSLREKYKWFVVKQIPTNGSYSVGCALDPSCIDILLIKEQERTDKVMQGLNKYAQDNKMKIVIVIIPIDYQIYPDAFKKYIRTRPVDPTQPDFFQKRFKQKLDVINLPYLDLLPVFIEATPSGYPFFAHDAHFNDLGTTIAAEAIGKYIVDKEL